MRILSATILLALFLPMARAQEGDPATAQLPKGTPISFRVASFDRIDAIVKEWVPMLKAIGLGAQVAPLEQMPASTFLFMVSGLNADIVDRTKPIYAGLTEQGEPIVVLHPAGGATWEGKKELREGAFAISRGGAVVVAEPDLLETEPRGTPTAFRVEGDAVLHVYLGDIVAEHKEEIEQWATEATMAVAAQGDVPEQARALILPIMTSLKGAVLSVESLDYGATWTGDRLETEGFLAIQAGSGLRNLLKRAGEPGTVDLAAYLPKEAYMTMTACMNPDWPTKEMRELLQAAGGEEVAQAIMQLLSVGSAFEASRTGRSAMSMNINMMMSANMLGLIELKPGSDGTALMASFDADKVNAALKKIGIPISYVLEKNVAKHGEISLHRFGMTSEDPQMAMVFSSMQGYMAIHKDLCFMAMSPTAEDDLKALIDKVGRGEKDAENPHLAAMSRLGRGHNIGFTINLGALKPMVMMLGMMGVPPEVMQVAQNVPDVFTLSTAVTFPDGNLRWCGDWPVKEAMKIAQAAMPAGGAEGAGESPPPPPDQPKPEDEEPEGEKFD
ncbi:MAG TPA: hypothetical protein VFY93_16510 [Planctomycetota bacterium]|nr:hypothetical protein [Planctomycetota bacterium]